MIENIKHKYKNYIASAYNELRQFQKSIMIRDFLSALIVLKKANSRVSSWAMHYELVQDKQDTFVLRKGWNYFYKQFSNWHRVFIPLFYRPMG